jgi:hypothetical protein
VTVYGEDVVRFVRDRAPGVEFGDCTSIGWTTRGVIVAGAVYHEWNPTKKAIEISVAGDGAWMTRGRAREMMDYPLSFCELVYGKTENPAIRRAWRHFGGTEYDIPGLWTFLTLTRDQWWRHRP